MPAHTDELVFFRRPPIEARLMAYELAPACRRSDLYRIFEQFGPLQSLDISADRAFINFYAASSANAAMSEIGSIQNEKANPGAPSLYGKRLLVRQRTKLDPKVTDWLREGEAVSQANLFLGFGGWSCRVLETQELVAVEGSADDEASVCPGTQVEYCEVRSSPPDGGAVKAPGGGSSSSGGGCGGKGEGNGLVRCHFFSVVQINIPRFGVSVKGRGYGLAGMPTREEALPVAKKAAVNQARSDGLRRVALVLLDGKCRYAAALPMHEEIETSIVWASSCKEPKPDLADLPNKCEGEEDDEASGADGEAARFGSVLRDLDRKTPVPVGSNWRLALALRTADPEPPSKRACYLAGLGGCSH